MRFPSSDTTTTVYLVRHGETDFNRENVIQGQSVDGVLNATGWKQAEALADYLQNVSFDACYVSPLGRTQQTAQPLLATRPYLKAMVLESLAEMGWGALEGQRSTPTVQSAIASVQARWKAGHVNDRVTGGESPRQVERRVDEALTHILRHHAGETILVITHGRWLRVALASLFEHRGIQDMDLYACHNTSVNQLVYDGRSFHPVQLQHRHHLEAPVLQDS